MNDVLYYRKGDILDFIKCATHVVHGCNCFRTMGTGVAKVLNEYTGGLLLAEDKKTPYGDINKLGTYSAVQYGGKTFYNAYTQHGYGRQKVVYVHWASVESCINSIISKMKDGDVLLMPPIGCGLGGGDIKDFGRIIKKSIIKSLESDKKIKIIVADKS